MTALRQEDYYVTPEAYLAAERISEVRHEYSAGVVYAMAGTTAGHNRLAHDIASLIQAGGRRERCEAFAENLRVRIRLPHAAEFYYYPDVLVDCSGLPNEAIYAEEPTVIFEVLSPDSDRYDRGEKFGSYRTIPSLRSYVLVDQFHPVMTVFHRDGDEWSMEFLSGWDAVLELPAIGARLRFEDVYARMGWPRN